MHKLLGGIFLLAWGAWCILAAFRGKKVQGLVFYDDEFLPKKILGKYYDAFMNLLYGTIGTVSGYFLIADYLK
jgi:hypothetical protein